MPCITYLGHATTLIEIGGLRILTDPVFSNHLLGLKRHSAPIQNPEQINPDVVLISHAHFDHLDLPSFRYIKMSVPIITPRGLAPLIAKAYQNPVIELETGASHRLNQQTTVRGVPIKHPSFRCLGLRYRGSQGYLIEAAGKSVLFLGDSAFVPDLKKDLAGLSPDCALLPIGAYEPRWFMQARHMNPEEALRCFELIGAKVMIPIHWGTFRLSLETLKAPLERLEALKAKKKHCGKIHVLQHGQSLTLDS